MTDRAMPRLKPEYANLDRFQLRLRTPAEREEFEREQQEKEQERTRGWLVCECCERKKPPGDYLILQFLVCCDCVDRGQRYGRPWRRRVRVPHQPTSIWFLNAAAAVLKEIDRECRKMHRTSQTMARLTPAFPPILTLPNLPKN